MPYVSPKRKAVWQNMILEMFKIIEITKTKNDIMKKYAKLF